MSESNTKEIELQQEIVTDERTLADGLARARKLESDTKNELANVEAELPGILLAYIQRGYGDENGDEKRREIRNQISELKADIAEMPFLDQGFEKERAKITAKQNRVMVYRAKRRSYEELKESLVNDPGLFGIAPTDNLRLLAKSLDCLDDCEAFIKEMQGVVA